MTLHNTCKADVTTHDTTQYCEHCTVVEVAEGDKYCAWCADVVTRWLFDSEMDKLAEQVREQIAIEKGLY